jgi:hypothetical protein
MANEDEAFIREESHNVAAMHNLALRALGNTGLLPDWMAFVRKILIYRCFLKTILVPSCTISRKPFSLPQALSAKCIALRLEQIAHTRTTDLDRNQHLPALERTSSANPQSGTLEQRSGSLLRRFS